LAALAAAKAKLPNLCVTALRGLHTSQLRGPMTMRCVLALRGTAMFDRRIGIPSKSRWRSLLKLRQEYDVLLLDCLTVWLSNSLYDLRRHPLNEIEDRVLAQLEGITSAASGAHLVIVSNEVGTGIVPATKVGRIFRDLQGIANQRVAAAADRVLMMVAGIPVQIKPSIGSIPMFREESV